MAVETCAEFTLPLSGDGQTAQINPRLAEKRIAPTSACEPCQLEGQTLLGCTQGRDRVGVACVPKSYSRMSDFREGRQAVTPFHTSVLSGMNGGETVRKFIHINDLNL